MKYPTVALVSFCVALAGCSRAAPTPLLPAAGGKLPFSSGGAIADAVPYRVLYAFKVQKDGHNPHASLIVQNGMLYGTTLSGGTLDHGTVFGISPSGSEKVLHSFKQADGIQPQSPLLNVRGTLYGTAYQGGASNGGTVYRLSPNGSGFKVLWSFHNGPDDGAHPLAGLVAMNGVLYGTTPNGGKLGDGVVYSITPQGVEHVLHSFSGPDGSNPRYLIVLNGALYGTTITGGAHNYGTVFRLTASGKEKVLYSFGGSDGEYPYGGVTALNGVLYGTTVFGGAHHDGTVFKLTLDGKEKVLYSFRGGTSPCDPTAPLAVAHGVLYGTTTGESSSTCKSYGAIFKITTAGAESTLHTFGNGSAGGDPEGGLVPLNDKLYGTTADYGTYARGVVYWSGE